MKHGRIMNWIKWKLGGIALMCFRLFPIKKNKVFVCNSYGIGYGDNPKYICQELITNYGDLDIVWAVTDTSCYMPNGIRKVKYKSISYYYEMSTAKIWLDNCRKFFYVRKRKGQFYIQTWHADIGLKKAEKDAEKVLDDKYLRDAKNDSKMIDLFVTGNDWMEKTIHRAYWYNGPVLKVGYPRRDIFYKATVEMVESIKKKVGVRDGENVFLYAPTFRHGQDSSSLNVYNIDWNGVKQALQKKFGGEWHGIARLHPNLSAYYNDLNIPPDVINMNEYPDMQELLLISDVCISDYSSALFDFAITGKPGFIYAEDVEEYKKDRGLLFKFEDLPFVLCHNNPELVEAISKFNQSRYDEVIKDFYKGKNHFYDDGNASDKIAEIIHAKCL